MFVNKTYSVSYTVLIDGGVREAVAKQEDRKLCFLFIWHFFSFYASFFKYYLTNMWTEYVNPILSEDMETFFLT